MGPKRGVIGANMPHSLLVRAFPYISAILVGVLAFE